MRKLLAVIIFISFASFAKAENLYVTDSFQITLRTGQGIEHKIVSMIPSGEKIEVVEVADKWTMIKRKDGTKGWVLSRFLTKEQPSLLKLNRVSFKYDSLSKSNERNIEELKLLRSENLALKKDLKNLRQDFTKLENRHDELKKESSDFLGLKDKYEENSKILANNLKKSQDLEKKLMERNIKVLITGALILLVGFIVGMSVRKKKRGMYY